VYYIVCGPLESGTLVSKITQQQKNDPFKKIQSGSTNHRRCVSADRYGIVVLQYFQLKWLFYSGGFRG
jgi:hypothetical protein